MKIDLSLTLLAFGAASRFFSALSSFLILSAVGRSSVNGTTHDNACLIVHRVASILAMYSFAAQLVLRLRATKQVGSEFGRSHMIEDMLTFLQPLTPMNSFSSQAVVQTTIVVILGNSEFLRGWGALERCRSPALSATSPLPFRPIRQQE